MGEIQHKAHRYLLPPYIILSEKLDGSKEVYWFTGLLILQEHSL